eukprot:gene11349-21540_t
MPGAKTGSKGKKKKSGKLSKAEKERLKREEAERKAQEEEEARLRAEQEAKDREEREKQEQEERRKLEEQERERHQAEIDQLRERIEQNKENLLHFQKERREQEKWDRYMLCDGRPDPTSSKELNTYLNLWKDESEYKDFADVLEECELTLELIAELQRALEEDEDLSENETQTYTESIREMYSLLEAKLDEGTMWLLKNPGDNINPETENLQCIVQSKNFKICTWGNTAKNPRVKSVDFPSEGFMIEIPRSLVLADVATRLLYRNYDTMSPRCSTYLPKSKKASEAVSLPPTETVTEEDKSEKVTEPEPSVPKTPDTVLHNPEPVREKSSSRKSRKSASRSSLASAKEKQQEIKEEEPKKEEVAEMEDKPTESEIKTFEEDDEDLLDEDVVDLRSFSPMGPVAFIELLELPPQKQKVDHWYMQQIVSSDLKRLNYAVHGASQGKSLNESQYIDQESRHIGSAKSSSSIPSTPNVSNLKPIAITLKLPSDVMFFEQPQLARWDEVSCHWKLDGFNDTMYDEGNRTISFKTCHFGAITIVQDLYLNMPFQSWELRPLSLNNCTLTVVAANVDAEIEIKCCLRKPDDSEALKGWLGEWMAPKILINKLRASGINIFPAQDGEKYVSICKKDPEFVDSVYEQLALSSSAYAYCWSKWNGVEECPEDTIVLGAVEWCKDEQPTEEDYVLYMASTRICYKLAMGEFDENFSKDIAENTQMHPGLFHMVQDKGNETAKQRVMDTSFRYADCVYQLLKATNVLVYS